MPLLHEVATTAISRTRPSLSGDAPAIADTILRSLHAEFRERSRQGGPRSKYYEAFARLIQGELAKPSTG